MNFLFKHKRTVVTVVALVLVLGIAGFAWRLRPDPHLAKIKELGEQLRGEEAQNLPPEERRKLWEEMRSEMEQLTPEQRDKLREEFSAERRRRMKERLEKYFSLPEDERTAFLDAEIDRMEARRQQWQRNGDQGGRPWGARGGAGGQAGDANASQGGTGGPSAEDRDQRRKSRLDSMTPEDRTMWHQYMKDLSDRRQQRGLPAGRGWGRIY
jgi:hypothetical protein